MLRRIVSLCVVSGLSIQLLSCATPQNPKTDPFENLNREIFGFNRMVDKALIKPVAYVYMTYLPDPLQQGVTHFFDNIREIPTVINDILQFRIADAFHDTSRFGINSTLGILGIFDPATSLGLKHNPQDFGQTLYRWGYKESVYIVIPFLGPSTIRDGVGKAADFLAFSIWPWIESDWVYGFMALSLIDERAKYLRHEKILDVIAIDEYLMMRDAYLQHREYIFTGKEEGIEEENKAELGSKVLEDEEDIADGMFEQGSKTEGSIGKSKEDNKSVQGPEVSKPEISKAKESKPLDENEEFFESRREKNSLEENKIWKTQTQTLVENQHP